MAKFEFKIEKGIALEEHGTRNHRRLDNIRQLKIGDSFLVPDQGEAILYQVTAAKSKQFKLKWRIQKDGKCRVWRVK